MRLDVVGNEQRFRHAIGLFRAARCTIQIDLWIDGLTGIDGFLLVGMQTERAFPSLGLNQDVGNIQRGQDAFDESCRFAEVKHGSHALIGHSSYFFHTGKARLIFLNQPSHFFDESAILPRGGLDGLPSEDGKTTLLSRINADEYQGNHFRFTSSVCEPEIQQSQRDFSASE